MDHVDKHRSPDIAADDAAVLVPEYVVHERVEVTAVDREVVLVAGRQVGVAVATQVGGDHFVAPGRERFDVAPPDALGLRIAMHQQQWIAAHALVDVRHRNSIADH